MTDEHHNPFFGRNVLITGGLGFIGSNLAHRLVEMGNVNVSVLDALIPGQGGNPFNVASIEDKIEIHHGDMRDDETIVRVLSGIDYVFNLAGSAGHLDSMLDPKNDLASNCDAQLSLLEACRNFNPQVKVVFTSTRQVYGNPLYLPVDEHHRISPLDINGVNKFAAENYHLVYHRIHGLRTVVLRLTNTYGPRQLISHDRHGFLPWFIRKAIDGETIQLFGGGRQTRDMNYVDDVIDALLASAASEAADGHIFNLGSVNRYSLEELANELISITGKGKVETIAFPPERQEIEIGNVYSSFEKIKNALGWVPKTDIRTGFTRTVEYYMQNREHYWNNDKLPLFRSIRAA